MPPPEQRPPVTLEDLLRLKRAERPSPEFWNRFERELHQKQLAALVKQQPWWQHLPRVFTRRAYVPLGAAAILAFTLVSVKFYAPGQIARVEGVPEPAPAGSPHAAAPAAGVVATVPTANRAEPAPAPRVDDRTPVAVASSGASVAEFAELVPWNAARPVDTPSARSIAANLATLEQTEPDLIRAINGRLGVAARSQPAPSAAGELATVTTNNSPRNRLLAYQYTDRRFTPQPAAPEIVRERLARRLSDPEITERFSRFGVQGDRVLVKF